ncbi:YbaK/EbsC family protein [Paenibacillus sp. MZ04-78.2]|uniref:aminoacyl-tRNA deacylase n=1 Tax=Paenibacillus sp. MZ04-78.2 TaxID=2962034 RepID=UPI0020B837CA|nr:YbaK/EbsC family protein [Paenibacillus sp. MZ04-78.2]MCP3772209.1 YbaK/EbsC family protein [Paenibacillus sp. MZ04-78.2]
MNQIAAFLQERQASFELLTHERPIRSAKEGAEYFGIEPGQTAPALILKSGEQYWLMIVSGDRGRVDLEDVPHRLGCPGLKMASPQEAENVTGFKVGAIPLVGLSLPCIMDRRLYRYTHIYGGTGELTSTLKICPADVEKWNQEVAWLE